MLLVKSMTVVYGYDLTGSDVVHVLATKPCVVATAARDDGGFYTVKESSKNLHSGTGAPIWSFNA
jgi:hypothetical protein